MTKEEIISNLLYMKHSVKEDTIEDITINEAIKVLQQEPCADAVSRQAVLEVIEKCHCEEWVKADIGAPIEALQPVTPAEKVGRWKRISMDKYSEHAKYWYRCDRCGEDNLGNTNYCPHCGAKMQEVEE